LQEGDIICVHADEEVLVEAQVSSYSYPFEGVQATVGKACIFRECRIGVNFVGSKRNILDRKRKREVIFYSYILKSTPTGLSLIA